MVIVTATRGRPRQLMMQASLLAKQVAADDVWVVVEDHQANETRVDREELAWIWGDRLPPVMVKCSGRKTHPGPNVAKRIGCAMAGNDDFIVELDDHDFIMPGALDAVRAASLQYDVVYGWCNNEPMRPYERWGIRDFPKGNPCIGLRGYRASLYRQAGGWPDEFPAGDYILMRRMECMLNGDSSKIVCLQQPLVVHGRDRDSIQSLYGDLRRRRLASK